MTTQVRKKWISDSICVDESQAILLLATPSDGCNGFYKAPSIDGNSVSKEWEVYLEASTGPIIFPHADYPDKVQAALDIAGTTLRELEQALGMSWDDWCS